MSGEAFSWVPKNPVIPIAPKYNLVETQSENFKKQIQIADASVIEQWELNFGEIRKDVGANNRTDLKLHYANQTHSAYTFSWTNPPTYISGSPITVRYREYEETPDVDGEIWSVKVIFEKVN